MDMLDVYFSLSTTSPPVKGGVPGDVQLVAIAATAKGEAFEKYIVPNCPIEAEATKLHGVSRGRDGIQKHGKTIRGAVSPEEALTVFVRFLRHLNEKKPVRLLSYNCLRFDSLVLCANFITFKIDTKGVIGAFGDVLKLAKTVKGEKKSEKYVFPALCKHFLGRPPKKYHDAYNDAMDTAALAAEINQHLDLENPNYQVAFKDFEEVQAKSKEEIQIRRASI